jgi:tRNA 2-selenouridine synthase
MEARAARIEEEYVGLPLRGGVIPSVLEEHLKSQLVKLKKRMGTERAVKILAELSSAFSGEFRGGKHHGWITMLLSEYYDPGYTYYFSRFERKSLYKGTLVECRAWIYEWIRNGRKLG